MDWGDAEQAARPVREYLEVLKEANDPKTPPKAITLMGRPLSWAGWSMKGTLSHMSCL